MDEIAITLSLNDYQKLEGIVNICEKSGVHTKFIPDYNRIIPTKPYIEDINGIAVVNIRKVPLSNWINMMIKRLIDIFGATCALLVFSIPMIVVAIIIKGFIINLLKCINSVLCVSKQKLRRKKHGP